MSVEPNHKDKAQHGPWLTIVGLGADGAASLSAQARGALAAADVVFGGARHLALVGDLLRGERVPWPSPLSEGIGRVLARRGRPTCVLASGDPFFFGIGATLAPRLAPHELRCFPAPSCVSLAAARLAWALADVEVVSLHGRALSALIRYLVPGRRVLALSWDGSTPHRVATLLRERGLGSSTLHVLEALGRDDERVRAFGARELSLQGADAAGAAELPRFDDLNLIALEVAGSPACGPLACHVGLPDSAFEHDGQISKEEIRAITLAALAPRAGGLLWDVGAGAGSIGIAWLRSHPACRALAIERDADRCARIARNAQTLGVPQLTVVHTRAPQGLEELARPDAVFIGGGGADPALFEACYRALRAGGRLVINAVSLETQARLLALHAQHGGTLRRIAIEAALPLGSMTAFRPALPVMQWRIDKP